MTKLELFEKLLKERIASYELQDLGVITDDDVVAKEESILEKFGYEYEEYLEMTQEEQDYPTPFAVISNMVVMKGDKKYADLDLERLVYESISQYDWLFPNDSDWRDPEAETTDLKDTLQQKVLDLLVESHTLVGVA